MRPFHVYLLLKKYNSNFHPDDRPNGRYLVFKISSSSISPKHFHYIHTIYANSLEEANYKLSHLDHLYLYNLLKENKPSSTLNKPISNSNLLHLT